MPVTAFAAGSLRKLLPALAEQVDMPISIEFGPSGVLKETYSRG